MAVDFPTLRATVFETAELRDKIESFIIGDSLMEDRDSSLPIKDGLRARMAAIKNAVVDYAAFSQANNWIDDNLCEELQVSWCLLRERLNKCIKADKLVEDLARTRSVIIRSILRDMRQLLASFTYDDREDYITSIGRFWVVVPAHALFDNYEHDEAIMIDSDFLRVL
jgi:hypothetical protein